MVITGLTRNFLKSWPFAPLKKPINTGFSPVRKLNILLFFPSVLSKSFWKKCGITYTESCPSGRRCSTRNFRAAWSFRPPEILDIKGFSKSKIEYFSVFSPAFLSKNFLSIKQTEIYTEGYRSGHNGADSKSVVRLIPDQGFESLTLRHRKACNQADCRLFSYVFF